MKISKYIVPGLLVLLFGACENDKHTFSDTPSIYLGGDREQGATADSVLFSFKKLDIATQTYDLNVMVYTTGVTTGRVRTFTLEVVDEESNVSPEDYSIGKMEIPANSYYAKIPVTVKRQVAGLDLSKENACLVLRVRANENFEAGAEEKEQYKLLWCNYLIEPAWWNLFAYYGGPFSQARYQFILGYYGDVNLYEMGVAGEGASYPDNYNVLFAFIAELIELLNDYNEQHPGEPYLNDNGQPLAFGQGLSY